MTAVTHPLARRPPPPFGSRSPRLVCPAAGRRLSPSAGVPAFFVRPSRTRFRRRRAVAALTAAVLLGAGAALVVPGEVSLASSGAPAALVPVARTTYVVQPGDTLWQIARGLQPSGDVRPLVQRLGAARSGAPLRAGERLALPGGQVTGDATCSRAAGEGQAARGQSRAIPRC